jgi:6-phosphogluconolactonase
MGIEVLDYDEGSGSLSARQESTGIENPSYLSIAPDGRTLHAVWEVLDWPEGLVSSHVVDASTGALTYLGVQGTRGSLACYATMDSRGRAAFVANYGSGSVAMLPVRADGSLAEASSVVQQHGSGPDPSRQAGPHAHCIVVSRDDVYAFSVDLGADAIFVYRIDYEDRRLVAHERIEMPPGSGPRHLVFAPDGHHAYAICELDSTLAALDYDATTGQLALVATHPMLPADFHADSHCAHIEVHPTGRFVYGSNRGHDSITLFAVDGATGGLRLIGHRTTEGATPRNFVISPDGRFLLVANQDSDTIVTMPIDAETGELGPRASVAQVPTPVCLKFGP